MTESEAAKISPLWLTGENHGAEIGLDCIESRCEIDRERSTELAGEDSRLPFLQSELSLALHDDPHDPEVVRSPPGADERAGRLGRPSELLLWKRDFLFSIKSVHRHLPDVRGSTTMMHTNFLNRYRVTFFLLVCKEQSTLSTHARHTVAASYLSPQKHTAAHYKK